MALKDKYASLIQFVQGNGVTKTVVQEQDGVLYVTCTAPSSAVKDQIWKMSLQKSLRSWGCRWVPS